VNVGAYVLYYNSRRELKRCLESIKTFDQVITIDGRFPNYPSPYPLSTDGSSELAKSYPNVVDYRMPLDQLSQRNFAMQTAEEMKLDYLLVLDSDAWVEHLEKDTFKKSLKSHLDSSGIFFNVRYQWDRLFNWCYIYKPRGLRYHRAHNILRHRCGVHTLIPWVDCPLIDGISINHNRNFRTSDSYRQRTTYRRWKKPIENEARIELGYTPMPVNAE